MRRRDALRRVVTAALLATIGAVAQELPPENPVESPDVSDWYRVEVLVFVREDAANLAAEQWDPLPQLQFPERYRHLVDATVADDRLARSGAVESHIDAMGRQHLLLPRPADVIDATSRPDALLQIPDPNAPLLPELVGLPEDPNAAAGSGGGTPLLPADPNSPEDAPPDPNSPEAQRARREALLATLPVRIPEYVLLPGEQLTLRSAAERLRRDGQRVLFHAAWWAPLAEEVEQPLPISIEAPGTAGDWPELQGTLHVYRSRYLHIAVDLWLNTAGSYLPEGWQIDPPPRAPLPLAARFDGSAASDRALAYALDPTLAVEDLWQAALPPTEPALPADADLPEHLPAYIAGQDQPVLPDDSAAPGDPNLPDDPNLPLAEPAAAGWPYRHAIPHRQSRRMRSEELHYLDHPVLGVLVRVTPVGDEERPQWPAEQRAWLQRHDLPAVAYPDTGDGGATDGD
jgi:hypothetical protein